MTPPLWESFLETVKEPCTVCKKGWRQTFSGNRILLSRQNARREKRSQKSQKDFFDKLKE